MTHSGDTPLDPDEHAAPTAEDGQNSFLGGDDLAPADNIAASEETETAPSPPIAKADHNSAYRVLARKYRPHRFEDLVGQEAMVQTLRNAFTTGRIAQAYMLTGLRGIGKTTTARIIARALNYDGVGGFDGPSVDMPELGVHCEDIMRSQHMDVLEMDAASNRGIGDIRDLISNVQYAPVLSRYKVYILDEVHMLTTEAFNALLKTLEEPPPHVKFIFATTDPRKVPVTILSRCQRFDLKRLDVETMKHHLANICQAEDVKADDDALGLISRASEGSVRDALSLLDQAIVLSSNAVTAEHIQDMMGLASSFRSVEMLKAMLSGHIDIALEINSELMGRGADPHTVLTDLADMVHGLTRHKILGDKDTSLSSRDNASAEILKDLANSLSHAILSRAWQILIAGVDELKLAPDAAKALDMIIIRLAYAAHLPPPDKLLAQLTPPVSTAPTPAPGMTSGSQNGGSSAMLQNAVGQSYSPNIDGSNPTSASSSQAPRTNLKIASSQPNLQQQPTPAPQPAIAIPRLDRFEDIVAFVGEKRDIKLKYALENDVVPLAINKGQIGLALKPSADTDQIRQLSDKLLKWTGQRWIIALSEAEPDAQTLREQSKAHQDELKITYTQDPEVQKILEAFPGSVVYAVRDIPLPEEPEIVIDDAPVMGVQNGFDELDDYDLDL